MHVVLVIYHYACISWQTFECLPPPATYISIKEFDIWWNAVTVCILHTWQKSIRCNYCVSQPKFNVREFDKSI